MIEPLQSITIVPFRFKNKDLGLDLNPNKQVNSALETMIDPRMPNRCINGYIVYCEHPKPPKGVGEKLDFIA